MDPSAGDGSHEGREGRAVPVWLAPVAWFILLVLGLYFFGPVSTVLLGVLAACIIACTLAPLMDYIPGPRGIDVAVLGLGLIVLVAAIIFALSWPLQKPIADAIGDWPTTKDNVNGKLKEWSDGLGLYEPIRVERLIEGFADFLAGQGAQQIFTRGADVVLDILIALAFSLIGSIFLLSEPPERIIEPGLRLLSPKHRAGMRSALADLGPRYRRWVIGTLTGMLIVFTASMIGFTAIQLKYAIPLALLAGFAEIVPTVGPAMACTVASLFALATQEPTHAAGVLVVYGIIQALEAYLILPLIMRGAVNIHPAITLFTVVLWGKIFGVPGLILAIPINLTIWTMLEHFRMRPGDLRESAGAGAGAGEGAAAAATEAEAAAQGRESVTTDAPSA